jgi:hypothetical protein
MYIPIQGVMVNFNYVRKFKIKDLSFLIYYSNGDSEIYYYKNKKQIIDLEENLGQLFKLYQKN